METIYIAAGGTGGHINAALSMEQELSCDYKIVFFTGQRYLDYQLFKEKKTIHLASKPLRTKNPFIFCKNIFLNIFVFTQIIFLYLRQRPKLVIGAGGYVCGPTLLAAKLLNIPIFIIEQNAVMGMTNKILSIFANLIFLNFKNTKGIDIKNKKIIIAGNPIRNTIKHNKNEVADTINILVYGGSLGAEQVNKVLRLLISESISFKISIIHQVGKSKSKDIKIIGKNIHYEQVEYIDNMNEKYKWANIIIARAGASTISELRVVRRPCILIPLPTSTDDHQNKNAIELKSENRFYVSIINSKLHINEMVTSIRDEIVKIKENKLFDSTSDKVELASILIKEEILKYVRS